MGCKGSRVQISPSRPFHPLFPVTVTTTQPVSFTVTFAPGATGAASATALFASNASNSPNAATLTGTGVSPDPHGGFVVDRELFFERHRVQSLSRRLCERMWCLFEGQRCPGCQHNVYGYFCGERSGLLLRDDRCRFECRRERILQYYSGGHSFPIALTAVTSRAFPIKCPRQNHFRSRRWERKLLLRDASFSPVACRALLD